MPAMVLPVLMITSGRPCHGPGLELLIRPEVSDDHQAVRDLHLAAFPDGESVATLVAALRTASAPLPPKSFVATISRQVVGHVLLSASRLDAPPPDSRPLHPGAAGSPPRIPEQRNRHPAPGANTGEIHRVTGWRKRAAD